MSDNENVVASSIDYKRLLHFCLQRLFQHSDYYIQLMLKSKTLVPYSYILLHLAHFCTTV